MPKPKTQKMQESINRARKQLPLERDNWLSLQPGNSRYSVILLQYGRQTLEDEQDFAYKRLVETAKAAHCDLHGNPLNEKE